MKKPGNPITAVDDYIENYVGEVREKLQEMRAIIRSVAPAASEAMKYGIPTFVLHGNLVHYGGYNAHIGFYPGASGIASFTKELSAYPTSKGAVRFPLDKPLPEKLIIRIVKFRMKENLDKLKRKK